MCGMQNSLKCGNSEKGQEQNIMYRMSRDLSI